jgi:hypothetical protein
MTVLWPEHSFGKNRKPKPETKGITMAEYAEQQGCAKSTAYLKLTELVEQGLAIKVMERSPPGKAGNRKIATYILKE